VYRVGSTVQEGVMNPASVDLQLSSGSLRVLRLGPPGTAAVVCVPGLSANARSFDVVAAKMARGGRQVAALDLRGRGHSPATAAGTYGWRHHAEDVLEVAGRLGFATFDLVGHSMGAFVAMQAAALAPARVRRVVLIDAVGRPDPEALPPIVASVQRLGVVYPSAEAYCDRIRRRGSAVPWESLWEGHHLYELESVPGGVRPRTSMEAVVEDMMYGAGKDPRQFWPGLRAPTLLVRASRPLPPGTGFVVGSALRDEFRGAVPSAEVVEVDANHYGVMAHPDALGAIDAFLARPASPSSPVLLPH
jgi:pimeloyl-ACP methyl ester carboxylesterase